MKQRSIGRVAGTAALAAAFIATPLAAQAYKPAPQVVYELSASDPCLKGRGNCAIYGKTTQLPSGRLILAFELSTVAASGSAIGQTMPVYKSDDYGDTWQPLSEVEAPAYLSDDPKYDRFTSNWTNPNFTVVPEDFGTFEAGTLLMATVVSGEDQFYVDNKLRDPNWRPGNDGDRENVAIALYASEDEGATWDIVDIIAEGGWQGGSAGAGGQNIAAANTTRQRDPLWEPHLFWHDDKLIAYYSDENDYTSFDPTTGEAIEDAANDTGPDSGRQVLVHKTWDGSNSGWSKPIVDIPGNTDDVGGGNMQIGGGRPGMTYIAPTTDGKFMITFEYFGGGDQSKYVIADDPERFFEVAGTGGQNVSSLPVTPGTGSGRVEPGWGNPVTEVLPDGRIVYNSIGSGDVWVNESGRSDGTWTRLQTSIGAGYSRALQYVEGTGRIAINQSFWGGGNDPALIRSAQLDIGDSTGTYYQLVNKATGQVIGTGGRTNDARFNDLQPDVRLEDAGSSSNADTQFWRLVEKSDGNHVLLNKSGGRHAAVWTGAATAGQRVGQWVDETDNGTWNVITAEDGTIKLQSVNNPSLYATGASANANITTQAASTDGSQDWELRALVPASADLTTKDYSSDLISTDTVAQGSTVELNAATFAPNGDARRANTTGKAVLYTSTGIEEIGDVAFDSEQRGEITLPVNITAGQEARIGVLFNDTPIVWDDATVTAAVVDPGPEPEPEPEPGPSQGTGDNGANTGGGTTGSNAGESPTGTATANSGVLSSTGASITGPLSAGLALLGLGGALLARRAYKSRAAREENVS